MAPIKTSFRECELAKQLTPEKSRQGQVKVNSSLN